MATADLSRFPSVSATAKSRRVSSSRTDNWSIARSLALLAALFAVVFGSLAPFAAQAAARPGQVLVLCSAEGPQTLALDAHGNPIDGKQQAGGGPKCAACLLVAPADLPQPPMVVKAAAPTTRPASVFVAETAHALPPARAPPRPPSTAPPQA